MTSIKIKIAIAVVCSLLTATVSFAQINPSSDYELRRYYEDSINILDPIEGIYDVSVVMNGGNNYGTFPAKREHLTLYIYRNHHGNFSLAGGEGTDFEVNYQNQITRLGSTNFYNYTIQWDNAPTDVIRFVLQDNTYFTVTFSVPQEQIIHDMGRYNAGYWHTNEYSWIKTYPTSEMYMQAMQKEMAEPELEEWSGTGFALNGGYFVTNYHVVENAKTITVSGINGQQTSYDAEVVASDKFNDLAIIKLLNYNAQDFNKIPYRIQTRTADVGEDIFVLGYPLISTMGSEIKLTTGIISSKTGYQGDVSLYQISAAVQPGNSGGPLFDKNGNIIGIVSAKHREAENAGYAIKTLYLTNLIESSSLSAESLLPSNNSISSLSLSDKVKAVDDFIVTIICSNK